MIKTIYLQFSFLRAVTGQRVAASRRMSVRLVWQAQVCQSRQPCPGRPILSQCRCGSPAPVRPGNLAPPPARAHCSCRTVQCTMPSPAASDTHFITNLWPLPGQTIAEIVFAHYSITLNIYCSNTNIHHSTYIYS